VAEIADLSAPPIAPSVTADVRESRDRRSPRPNPFFDVHVHDASHAVPLLVDKIIQMIPSAFEDFREVSVLL
jgi:hypothetical protein